MKLKIQNKANETLPEEENTEVISEYGISISPNPANPRTMIYYSLPEASLVKLDIYSITGQKINTLVNGFVPAGNHNVIFDGSRIGSGIYLYRFKAENFNKTGKILIVK